jgi:NTP pyrophosphatase (non-canonical NTP hydrolase)
MTLDEYQQAASRTLHSNLSDSHMASMLSMGLAGEAGETVDLLKKVLFHNHRLDPRKLAEELGDTLFYLSGLCRHYGFSLEQVAKWNISKLMVRYPEKYSDEASIARKDVTSEPERGQV